MVMEEFVMGDHSRLVAYMRLAMELAASSRFFAKLSDLFASDAAFRDALARVRGAERLRVVAYGLGGAQYSWAPRFRLAVLLLLRDTFPDAVGEVEVVCPTAAPVERRAMEELGCVVTASAQQCRPVREPTLIFMPYPDRVFFENLLTLNWSAEQLGKIEKFGVTEQREKAKRIMSIQQYVREIKLCAEIDGLLDSPLWEDDSPDPFQKRVEHLEDDDSETDCKCMHCAARRERYAMISALPSAFSVHLFHLGPDIDMGHLMPGNSTTMVWSRVNVRMNYNTQLAGWHLNPSDAYIEGKDIKEATSIVKEVRETIADVRSSSLYRKFVNQLKGNPSIVDRISRMLGAHDCMELVIYGIGSFEFDVKSQYQLALALLLKEDELEFLEVDDDMGIYSKLPNDHLVTGLKLKEKVYLNFMQEMEYNSFFAFDHLASLRVQLEERISRPFREDRPGYMDDYPPLWGHVFRHRLPAKNRTAWSPPPKGWMKLNFHGIGCCKGRPAGIGGILHNDKGQVLSYYAGPVEDVDQNVASAMALEIGLQNIIKLHEPVYKLIVEGDDLKVIRCFNGISSPPKRYSFAFSCIRDDMSLRPIKKPGAEKLPEECNSGEDDDDGSKDDDNSDHRKDKDKDDDDSQGASSELIQ
ncbi:unnamed protein product [Urochloa decumbens]|uniref:SRR1-like domain-containing protein n=1 Tax=Urochloa decumbens TaxID=240449 RepID=A0ABC9C6H9_9POAL